jgi:hypothetical protein
LRLIEPVLVGPGVRIRDVAAMHRIDIGDLRSSMPRTVTIRRPRRLLWSRRAKRKP